MICWKDTGTKKEKKKVKASLAGWWDLGRAERKIMQDSDLLQCILSQGSPSGHGAS